MTSHNAIKRLNVAVSRRQVMVGAAGMTFALAFDGGLDGAFDGVLDGAREAHAATLATEPSGRAFSPWVSIAPDGAITIMSPAAEMGQGSRTSLPRVIAEELDADWDKVRVVPAPPVDAIYGNPGFGGMMYTAGSNAVTSYFKNLRVFGAQVRRVLIDNAAINLGVPADELTTEPSVVVHAKSGRKLDYGAIAAFAEVPAKAPEIRPDQLKRTSAFRLIGHDAMRVDLPGKVNGSAQYAIDTQVPGMIYGAVLRSPVEGAAPERVDEAGAMAVNGVIKVVRLPYGVAILAQTPWAAFEAREAVARTVTWTRAGTAWGFDSDKGLEEFAAAAADLQAPAADWDRQGDALAALANAATVVDATYRCDYAYHAQMEPLNAVASVSPAGDAAEIWCGTQSQSMAIGAVAKVLSIPRERVVLHDTLMGGGFGRRGHRDEEFIIDAVLLAKAAGTPVKVMWTREDDVHNGRFRPLTAHHLRAGLDASGKLVAWHHRVAGDRVLPFADPLRYQIAKGRDGILMRGVELKTYDIPHQLDEQLFRDTGVRTSPLRGIGFTANKFVTEAFLDEVAQKRGIDPVALRLELLKNLPRGRAVVEAVAKAAEWERKRDERGRQERGLGFAFIDYSDSYLAGIAEVSLERRTGRIKVHNFWCAIDCGIAVHPDNVIAQSESSIVYGLGMTLSERISVKDGAVEQSNFYDYQVPRMSDVPAMHIEVIATDNHPTGAGQMATPLVAPAVSSAIAQLTGVRLRHSPFTPERVKQALG